MPKKVNMTSHKTVGREIAILLPIHLGFIILMCGCVRLNDRPKMIKQSPPATAHSNWVADSEFQACKLTISSKKKLYSPLEPIEVLVTLTNNGPQDVVLGLCAIPSVDFPLHITGPHGRDIDLTRYGAARAGHPISSKGFIVHRGESMAVTETVNRLYDMTVEGTYFISTSKTPCVVDDNRPLPLSSNALQIQIIQQGGD